MKVRRVMPEEGWTPMANTAHRDYRLTWRARGLLGELLSYPDGWDINIDKLVAQAREVSDVTEGREAMRKAMKELAAIGYVRYIRERDEHGRWTTDIAVCDVPQPEPDARRTRNRTVGKPARRGTGTSENRAVGEPDCRDTGRSEDRHVTKKTDLKTVINTEDQTLSDEYSTSLASLAAADAANSGDDVTEQQLQRVYNLIDRIDPETRRRHLLRVERKRPKIYRDGRNAAIDQIKSSTPDDLTHEQAAIIVDTLSYKWMAQHYAPNWPLWFKEPLDAAYRAMQEGVAA